MKRMSNIQSTLFLCSNQGLTLETSTNIASGCITHPNQLSVDTIQCFFPCTVCHEVLFVCLFVRMETDSGGSLNVMSVAVTSSISGYQTRYFTALPTPPPQSLPNSPPSPHPTPHKYRTPNCYYDYDYDYDYYYYS